MMNVKHFIIFLVFYTFGTWSYSEYVPLSTACNSQIYCNGTFLHTVQMLRIYNDSKTFVDMKAKCHLDNFTNLLNTSVWKNNPNKDTMKGFIAELCFDKEGSELEEWTPPDWISKPKFLKSIKDTNLRDWAFAINNI